MLVRPANRQDLDQLNRIDEIAKTSSDRRAFIQRSVDDEACWVIIVPGAEVIGYGVLEYSFFGLGFISMLYIHRNYRRYGAGSQLMEHLESVCRTAKLFTSTNLSNRSMQALLEKRKYILSGVLHHLDEEDPELVFVKYLKIDK
jgi:ribosomal protein S18 acetylase RimI-like enzyme